MRKKLLYINGCSGVGKSTTSIALMRELPNCAFLDLDWCFKTHPKISNAAIKDLQDQNCAFLVNNYLHTPTIENIIVCGSIDDQQRINRLLSQLDLRDVDCFNIILTVNEKVYKRRFQRDIKRGRRPKMFIALNSGKQVCEKNLNYKLSKLPKYEQLDGIKIDTSNLTVEQVVEKIKQLPIQIEPMVVGNF